MKRPLAVSPAPLIVILAAVTFAVLAWTLGLGLTASLLGAGAALIGGLLGAQRLPDALPRLRATKTGTSPLGDGAIEQGDAARDMLRALDVAALLIDAEQRIVAHNKMASELFPYLTDGVPLAVVSRHPDLTRMVARVTSSGRSDVIEISERLPTARTLRVSAAALLNAKRPGPAPLMLLQFKDTGEQARLAQLRSDFIANASHELRTPLASIKGFIETLQGPARADDAARTRFLGIMEAQAGRMNRILDDLLSLSRIEMRAHLYPDTVVDLSEAVRSALRGLEPLASEAKISLKMPADADGFWVRGDSDELEQVVQNLVHNAIKYGKEGGKVDVDLTRRRDRVTGRDLIDLSVSDDGPGIAPEHLPRLTERFYRVDTARSRERGGTGLGLAIVKHILNRHWAELDITSQVGRGSVFTVTVESSPSPDTGLS